MTANPALNLPLVSTIMPAYNHARFVEQAILSVAKQTYPNIELVVIDDGSTDATRDVIAASLDRLDREFPVRFLTQPNAGVCATLNRGLSIAKGPFVQFLASDDAYLPDKTSACMAALLDQPQDVAAVYCDGYVMDAQGRTAYRFSDIYPVPVSRNLHAELLVANWIPAMGLTLRRDVVDRVGLFDADLKFEDWDLLLRLSREHKLARIKGCHFLYRLHDTNLHANQSVMAASTQTMGAKYPELGSFLALKAAWMDREPRRFLAQFCASHLPQIVRMVLRKLQVTLRAPARRTPFR